MTAPLLVRTVTDKGTTKIVPMTLGEWAERFNTEHRLHPPKVKR